MIVDGVNFIDSEVAKMSRDSFIKKHIGVFWQDISEKKRQKKLEFVYDTIVPPTPAVEE